MIHITSARITCEEIFNIKLSIECKNKDIPKVKTILTNHYQAKDVLLTYTHPATPQTVRYG